MVEITPVGDIHCAWGESARWDDRRQRLLFTDCGTSELIVLDPTDPDAAKRFRLGSMLAGLVLTDGPELIGCLADGLHVIDPDAGTHELLTPYPDGLGDRANDAHADLDGNLVTGTLNLGPAEGSTWQYSAEEGWRLLDPDIANTNGPNAIRVDGHPTLVVGDTSAVYWAYEYDPVAAKVGPRRTYADPSAFGAGRPDGSTVDADGGLWVAAVFGSAVARYAPDGLDRVVELPTLNPTDLAFGGPDLDRLFVTTIDGDGGLDGRLLVIDGLGVTGRPEPRFALRGAQPA